MNRIENLTIGELESYFNLTQTIIDTIIRTNHSVFGTDNDISNVNKELSKYNSIRDRLLSEIVKRIEFIGGYRFNINIKEEENEE